MTERRPRVDIDARRQRAHRQRSLKLRYLAALGSAGLLAIVLTLDPTRVPLLVWNATASVTPGLYRVSPHAAVAIDDIVIAYLSPGTRGLAAARGYLPAGVPLVKPVAAIEGDLVCAGEDGIFINGRWVTDRARSDAAGRSMPRWDGCARLSEGAVFLLVPERADSFDGRYFGITDAADVVGTAQLIWAP